MTLKEYHLFTCPKCDRITVSVVEMCGFCGYDLARPARPKRKELEAQLATANAELESMHRELADKQAIIDEQKREIAQLRMWMRLYEWGGGF